MRRTISDSSGLLLIFEEGDEDLLKECERKVREAENAAYAVLRLRHGIWASNQGKYVQTVLDLNERDSKAMEIRYGKRTG